MGGTVDRMFMSGYIDASGVGPANGREIQFVENVENQTRLWTHHEAGAPLKLLCDGNYTFVFPVD